jgi:hypothetical protein
MDDLKVFSMSQYVYERHGAEKAMIIHHIAWWINYNTQFESEDYFHDGHYWTILSAKRIAEHFCNRMTRSKVQRLLSELIKDGVLESANHSKTWGKKIRWYRIKDTSIAQICAILAKDPDW